MTVFVDTSAIYAFLDADDANHAGADHSWRQILEQRSTLLTSNYVLLEVSALLQACIGSAALRTFHADIEPLLQIDWISERRHHMAVATVLTTERKKLSVVDCVSFQCMREHGVRTAFCFDRHFREQGFETIP